MLRALNTELIAGIYITGTGWSLHSRYCVPIWSWLGIERAQSNLSLFDQPCRIALFVVIPTPYLFSMSRITNRKKNIHTDRKRCIFYAAPPSNLVI